MHFTSTRNSILCLALLVAGTVGIQSCRSSAFSIHMVLHSCQDKFIPKAQRETTLTSPVDNKVYMRRYGYYAMGFDDPAVLHKYSRIYLGYSMHCSDSMPADWAVLSHARRLAFNQNRGWMCGEHCMPLYDNLPPVSFDARFLALRKLRIIDLSGTHMPDAASSLAILAKLPHLKKLYLGSTNLPKKEVKAYFKDSKVRLMFEDGH